jgi:hypothetical protein
MARGAITGFPAGGALPLRTLHATLRSITERLAHELAQPGTQMPDWSATEWAIAPAVVAIHGVAALLQASLPWRGPPPWNEFLRTQATHVAQRAERIERVLRLLDLCARDADLALVPLKGAALHAFGVYRSGERPMADIDLLVSAAQEAAALELLRQLGFHETSRSWKHRVLEPGHRTVPAALGEHADNGLRIELHCRVAEQLPLRAVDCSQLMFPPQPQPGLNGYPSRGALLIHVLLHAAGALAVRELRLLHLCDIARLAARMSAAEWQETLQQLARLEGGPWWVYPPLALAARYFGTIPPAALRQAEEACHRRLRRAYRRCTIAQASASYLWISALPGLAWPRSLRELGAYVGARFMPDAEARAQRRECAHSEPRISGGSWSQLSQRQRVLRYLLARQPRHLTLEPVRAALRAAQPAQLQARAGSTPATLA